jgi:hypothetical protein
MIKQLFIINKNKGEKKRCLLKWKLSTGGTGTKE